ncbi:MAG: Lrp/AsnC family transcriptional regulator [Amphritea sp.]|nr:Lrp/AsnC family transcriptional regulator [Amphritea sp.]
MDSYDQKIIAALKDNARQSVSAIAEQVHLSRSAVSDRIKRMEEQGVILGYQVLTATESQPTERLKAYFEIRHGGFKCRPLVEFLMQYPEVQHCYGTSGAVDLLVYLEFDQMQRLHDILSAVDQQLPKDAKIVTHMVMQEWGR